MRRRLVLVLLLPLLLLPAGCLGPLATMLARGPEAVAKNMGQAAGYNAASQIAGSELGRDAEAAADTMANIDRIMQEHPDALNAGELQELKQDLAEDLPPPGSEDAEATNVAAGTVEADHSLQPTPRRPSDPHDRRRADRGGPGRELGTIAEGEIGTQAMAVQTRNRLRIERVGPLHERWRPTDPHRFTTPSQSSFEPVPPPLGLHSLTGEAYAPRDFSRVMLPQVESSQPQTITVR